MQSEEGKKAAQRFNEIVLKVVDGQISREEAFRLAAELSADLGGASGEADALKEGLAKRGASLKSREVTRKLGEALQEGRFSDAADALKRLSERLQSDEEGLSERELSELREALDEARKAATEVNDDPQTTQSDESEARELERRRDELKKKEEEGTATAQEKAQRRELDRQLKRLGRRKQQPPRANRGSGTCPLRGAEEERRLSPAGIQNRGAGGSADLE
jgi:DNA repair exonuclease SbcCD ATPase subunit